MKITKLTIENYRGVKTKQTVPLSNYSSVVGRNDSGKSIVSNAIASFLDPKEYPVTETDFNDRAKPIIIRCCFTADDLKVLLELKVKSKIKKTDGLDEFLDDINFDGSVVYEKAVSAPKKGFDTEKILFMDYTEPEFSMLYTKSDEELAKIIADNNIAVPVEGKGRNSKLEKIKHIKTFCQGKERTERLIEDEYKIASLFPEVELFKSDYGLEADTKFKTTSVSEIQNYFEQETSSDDKKLKQVEKEIEVEMQNEAQTIKGYMKDYVSSLSNVEIKPTIVWKDAIKSVDVSFQFDGDDKPIPMSHKGTGYRRLFMVARFRFLAEKNKGNNVTYLIEEPETFLHPAAQEDLLNAFRDLSADNQIIITTHSPVFAGATNVNSVLLSKKNGQTVYEYAQPGKEAEFMDRVVEELGIKPSFNLKDFHEKIVFVESSNDSKFYDLVCKNVIGFDLLKNRKVLVLPFGGGEDIESFLNIDYFDKSGRELYLIIDSDKHVNKEAKQKQRAADFELKPNGKAYVVSGSCIENYYHPRAFERVYGLPNGTFDFIKPEDNARNYIKSVVSTHSLKQIKEKNNMKVFEGMTKDEWEEVVEPELIDFLKLIVNK